MNVVNRRLVIWGSLLALLAAGIAYALRPQPIPVDLATAEKGFLRVTIDEEGETRVRDVYTLHAPLRGQLQRITAEAGDLVVAGETQLAQIEPAPPAFLDVRIEAELQAAVEAARAAHNLAAAELNKAKADLTFAEGERARARLLIERRTISQRALEDAERAHNVAQANLATAEAALKVREHELHQAQSRLLSRQEIRSLREDCECMPMTAPVSGVVLQVMRRSEGVVEAGTPLLDIGNPADLEIVVNFLSEDAVRIRPGQRAIITDWGGEDLNAVVRRIEPFGQTQVVGARNRGAAGRRHSRFCRSNGKLAFARAWLPSRRASHPVRGRGPQVAAWRFVPARRRMGRLCRRRGTGAFASGRGQSAEQPCGRNPRRACTRRKSHSLPERPDQGRGGYC